MTQFFQQLLEHYGYLVLGLALMLELLALPLPGEILMTYAGLMVYQGHLNWPLCIVTAGLGASAGMTLSYWIGLKLGTPFIEKYGSKLHFGPEKAEKTSRWFERYGNKLLIIAFYIHGVRHITGYFSGLTRMPFRTFAVYAYTGAFLWTGVFISLGKVLGPEWEKFHRTISKYLLIAGIAAAAMLLTVYAYRKYRKQIFQTTAYWLAKGIQTFHSFGKVRFLVLFAFAAFLALFILMAGLIQDFLAHEFAEFDDVTTYLVHAVFDESWAAWMDRFERLSSYKVLLTLVALTAIRIWIKGRDRLLEAGFLLLVLVGGELWEEMLRRLFHRTGPGSLTDTFPSEQTLITLVFLGFAAFLFVRHSGNPTLRFGALLVVLAFSFLVGLSRIYFHIQYPSDVAAGYVFGGVWLSLHIVLLELFRLLRNAKAAG